jgi:hypothetical protein
MAGTFLLFDLIFTGCGLPESEQFQEREHQKYIFLHPLHLYGWERE